MSETSTETTETATETTEFTPITSQEDFDRRIAERINRTKAQFKDYPDLKKKAEEFDKLTEAQKTELQKASDELSRWQSEAEKWRSSTVTSRIEALAATDFAYPADAVAKLDPAKYLGAGGEIDDTAIKTDLAALLEERPNWRRDSGGQTRVPAPNRAQGSSADSTAASADPAQAFAAFLGGQLQAPRQ